MVIYTKYIYVRKGMHAVVSVGLIGMAEWVKIPKTYQNLIIVGLILSNL
jgi:hypothetical protein